MIIACALLTVALVAVATVLVVFHAREQQRWADERRELLNRIQAPQHIPVTPTRAFIAPEPEVDLSSLVGAIDLED